MFWNQYPYINLNDLNLDFLLKAIGEMRNEVTNFVSINAIKYADPIQWDITRQYEKNTIVIDPVTGTAYISVAPVPVGVALTRPEYWTVVFDLQSFVTKANQNLANNYEEQTTTTATMNTSAGHWVIWGDVLYKALVNITAGDAYVVGSNIEHITIEDVINAIMQEIANEVQARQDADTALQGAIDGEVQARQDADTALQGAIDGEVQARQDADTALQGAIDGEVQARQNAIKEKPFVNVRDYGAVGDGVTDDYQAFVDAIAAGSNTGATVIVPDGNYYLSAEPAVTNLNSGDNLNLLLGYNVEFSGAGAGNPNNPVLNGKLLSPVCNKGNRLRGFSFKSYDNHPSPAGNGSTFHSIEWLADTTDDYINVTGSISSGSYVMTLSSVEGVSLGAGVVPVNPISGFPDGSTKQNTARVTAINFANNTIEIGFPSDNPAAWAGIATSSPWTGASITNQPFKIRKRAWNVTQFIGALAGSGNVDRIAYGQNIVTSSDGNLTYGIELDMDFGSTQTANADVIHKGMYILGFGTAQPLSRALSIEHSASNWSTGVHVQNAYHGVDLENVAGGVSVHRQFYNRSTGDTVPLEFGFRTDDLPDSELVVKSPVYAGTQITNGASVVYLKRENDTAPTGKFIDCVGANGSPLFAIDIDGSIVMNASTINSGATTSTLYHAVIKSTDGHTYAIPLQQLT